MDGFEPGGFQSGEGSNQYLPWFALRVRPRFERRVAERLCGKNLETFLPQYTSVRHWKDRKKQIQLPMFSGYIFCRIDLNRRLPILTTPGVLSIVGIGKEPVAVAEHEIAAIQAAVTANRTTMPWTYLEAGDRVRIIHGPLSGIEGILVTFRGSHRLVVNVTLLRRSVATEVDRDCVESVANSRRRAPHSERVLVPAS